MLVSSTVICWFYWINNDIIHSSGTILLEGKEVVCVVPFDTDTDMNLDS